MRDKENIRHSQTCTRCVMDTTDPDIVFDAQGVCNHCHMYDNMVKRGVFSGEEGIKKLSIIVDEIKKAGKKKKYDCIIGISGGVDSTYVAYKVKEMGLRPLAVHLDNGWNSELAVKNIEQALKVLKIDLYTHVIDWEEFKDLQLAFLKASTPDAEIPTDHAIVSCLYDKAKEHGVRVIAGYNARTESHVPTAWSQGHYDLKYIKSIHKLYGKMKLTTFPMMNYLEGRRYHLNIVNILDYLDYNKQNAMQVLERKLGWKYYGGKHYESIYTRFYQGYILKNKFGYDKRKAHFSSLICSNEMSRNEALIELKNDPYQTDMQITDKDFVIKKFDLTEKEFDELMNLPKKSYWDYPSYGKIVKSIGFRTVQKIYRLLRT